MPATTYGRATFRGYLRAQTERADPVGDLARQAFGGLCSGGCPFTTWAGLVGHLSTVHDLDGAAGAALRRAAKEHRSRGGRR